MMVLKLIGGTAIVGYLRFTVFPGVFLVRCAAAHRVSCPLPDLTLPFTVKISKDLKNKTPDRPFNNAKLSLSGSILHRKHVPRDNNIRITEGLGSFVINTLFFTSLSRMGSIKLLCKHKELD